MAERENSKGKRKNLTDNVNFLSNVWIYPLKQNKQTKKCNTCHPVLTDLTCISYNKKNILQGSKNKDFPFARLYFGHHQLFQIDYKIFTIIRSPPFQFAALLPPLRFALLPPITRLKIWFYIQNVGWVCLLVILQCPQWTPFLWHSLPSISPASSSSNCRVDSHRGVEGRDQGRGWRGMSCPVAGEGGGWT